MHSATMYDIDKFVAASLIQKYYIRTVYICIHYAYDNNNIGGRIIRYVYIYIYIMFSGKMLLYYHRSKRMKCWSYCCCCSLNMFRIWISARRLKYSTTRWLNTLVYIILLLCMNIYEASYSLSCIFSQRRYSSSKSIILNVDFVFLETFLQIAYPYLRSVCHNSFIFNLLILLCTSQTAHQMFLNGSKNNNNKERREQMYLSSLSLSLSVWKWTGAVQEKPFGKNS